MEFLATFGAFLVAHPELIEAVIDAVEGAADPAAKKAEIMRAIREGQIAAADAAVQADLGPRPQ